MESAVPGKEITLITIEYRPIGIIHSPHGTPKGTPIQPSAANGTPLLDIKPYVPQFDVYPVEKIGWIEKKTRKIKEAADDGRFTRD